MDIYLKIVIGVWLIFMYGIVTYRIFFRKGGKTYTRENIGLILVAFTILLLNQLNVYLTFGFGFIGVALMIALLTIRRNT